MKSKNVIITFFVALFVLVISTNYKLEAAKTHQLQTSEQVQVLSDGEYAKIEEKNKEFKDGYYELENFELRPNYIFKTTDYMSVKFVIKYDFNKAPLTIAVTDKLKFTIQPLDAEMPSEEQIQIPETFNFELSEHNTYFMVRIRDLENKLIYQQKLELPSKLKDYKMELSSPAKATIGRVQLLTKATEIKLNTLENPISVSLDKKEVKDKKKEAKRLSANRNMVYKETMPEIEVTNTKNKKSTKALKANNILVNDKDVRFDYKYGAYDFDFILPLGEDKFNVATETCELYKDQVIMLEKTDCFEMEAVYEDEAKKIKTDDLEVNLVEDDNFTTKKAGEYEPIYELKYVDPVGNISLKSVRTLINNTRTLRGVDYGDAPSSYGTAGTNVDDAERYQLGKNDTLFTDYLNVDIESSAQTSSGAKGDDSTGRNDEDAIYNHAPGTDININTADGNTSFALAYNIATASTIGSWLDDDKNGVFDTREGLVNQEAAVDVLDDVVKTTGYTRFNIDFSSSALKAGDSTFLRFRIAKGANSLTQADGAKKITNVGETEDHKVNFYNQNNSEIKSKCNGTYVSTNEFKVEKAESIVNGQRYTFDVGTYNNATMEVTSPSGIKTLSTSPLRFETKNDEQLKNEEIKISVRDANGNKLYLPLNFSFWNNTPEYGNFKVGIKKNDTYKLAIDKTAFKLNSTSKVAITENSNYIYAASPGIRKNDPDESFLLQKDTLAMSELSILEVDGKSSISVGLNMNRIDTSFQACNDSQIELDAKPEAYIYKYDDRQSGLVGLYANSPFKYVVDNVEMPTNTKITKIENTITMPSMVEFDGGKNVTIYRRLKGSGNNYVKVPPLKVSQTYSTGFLTNKSVVKMDGTATHGYEYRFEYDLVTKGNFNQFLGGGLYSAVKYSTSTTTHSEINQNSILLYALQPFSLKFTAIMGDPNIMVESKTATTLTKYNLDYTYRIKNCPSCNGSFSSKKKLTDEGIIIPISKPHLLETTDNGFGNVETIEVRLYDGFFKVHTFTINRWYPSRTTKYDITKPAENLNPIANYYHVTNGLLRYPEVINQYGMESFERAPGGSSTVVDGKLTLKNLMKISNKAKTVPKSWTGITQDQIVDCDYTDWYMDHVKLKLLLPSDVLDATLQAPTTTINGKEYKEIDFNMDKLFSTGEFEIAGNYVVEQYSGRLYNKDYGTLATPTIDKAAIRAGANDASDVDLPVNGSITNQFLLDPTSSQFGKNFTYYFTYYDYGLNQIQLREGTTSKYEQKNLGYFKKHSKYYFKANLATEYEANCVKYNICKEETQYATIYEGRITALNSIRKEISEDHSKIRSFKGANNWIDKYIVEYNR